MWIVAGGVLAAVVVAAVGVAALAGNDAEPVPPQPPSGAAVEASDLEAILLTATEVDAIMGTTNTEPGEVITHLDATETSSSNPSCAVLLGTATGPVYEGSGYTAVRDQRIEASEPDVISVLQSAVAFNTADEAIAFRNGLADRWRACANEAVAFTDTDNFGVVATLGDVTETDSQIEQPVTTVC